ncbi:ATP-binding protein [Pseudomonas aeruginosa]|nr:ATP-binding protein [Pseudomonas aeruginosa]ELC8327451.1 ATP-binding protein [Pseudomonas aeruginosa]ELX9492994.1 ATP-binding protein [Pseudomonas aeruginosa]MBG4629078.1 ATP-binding protein [Pseudomonas aeruginosa]MBG6338821.1 ATP-binding protein [Pseudomonas aeruginosa]
MIGMDLDSAIRLPRGLGADSPRSLFSLCAQIMATKDRVDLDASELTYIDPLGMATLRALLEGVLETRRVCIHFLPKNLTSYLARMDFFKDLDIEGVDLTGIGNRQDRSGSLLEITKVTEHHHAEMIASKLASALTGRLTQSAPDAPANEATGRNEFDSYRAPIEYALKELLENSLTHARREGCANAAVWVACQYYPKLNLVRMAIVDNGCGILATLQRHPLLAEKTHLRAIEAALKPRISCNRGAMAAVFGVENQGIGLTTTAEIARVAGGGILLASGNAVLETRPGKQIELDTEVWRGVSIGFFCDRRLLPQVSVSALLPEDPANAAEVDLDDMLNFR